MAETRSLTSEQISLRTIFDRQYVDVHGRDGLVVRGTTVATLNPEKRYNWLISDKDKNWAVPNSTPDEFLNYVQQHSTPYFSDMHLNPQGLTLRATLRNGGNQ